MDALGYAAVRKEAFYRSESELNAASQILQLCGAAKGKRLSLLLFSIGVPTATLIHDARYRCYENKKPLDK